MCTSRVMVGQKLCKELRHIINEKVNSSKNANNSRCHDIYHIHLTYITGCKTFCKYQQHTHISLPYCIHMHSIKCKQLRILKYAIYFSPLLITYLLSHKYRQNKVDSAIHMVYVLCCWKSHLHTPAFQLYGVSAWPHFCTPTICVMTLVLFSTSLL